jgi:catechol 2,3-dioxygenase-like lactoylglutathione lyase family enzyme
VALGRVGARMLGEHLIHPVLLATDLGAARDFYHDRLGLEILNESEAAIVFRCGGGTQLAVTKSTTGTADTQTQASWLVKDVRAEVAELRSRGAKVEEYDPARFEDPGRRRRHRVRLGSVHHRPGQERAGHPPDQGVKAANVPVRPATEMVVLARPCWL